MSNWLDMKFMDTIRETETGRDERFMDRRTKKVYTRGFLVKGIEDGRVTGYIRKVNGARIPCKMPRRRKKK